MSEAGQAALQQALACMAAPALLPGLRAAPLPADVLLLLKLAANDEDSLASQARARGLPAGRLHDVAVFYIQQVLFAPGADSYRVLGARPEASAALLREHYRWLVRWLHPDRNRNDWEDVYLERVHRAWQQLRTPERRRLHDLSSLAERSTTPVVVAAGMVVSRGGHPGHSRPPGRRKPVLPILVAGALVLGLFLVTLWEPGIDGEPVGIAADAGAASSGHAPDDDRRTLLPSKAPPGPPPAVMNPVPLPIQEAHHAGSQPQAPQPPRFAGKAPMTDRAAMPVARVEPVGADGRGLPAPPGGPAAMILVREPAAIPPPGPAQAREAGMPVALPTRSEIPPAGSAQIASRPSGTPESMPAAGIPRVATPLAGERSASAPATGSRQAFIEMNDRIAFSLAQKFRRAYNDCDPEAMAELFLDGPSRHRVLEALRSQPPGKRAKLTFGRLEWRMEGEGVLVEAGYRTLGGGPAGSGKARFELRRQAGEFRILRVDPEVF